MMEIYWIVQTRLSQIHISLWILPHLLQKPFQENFIVWRSMKKTASNYGSINGWCLSRFQVSSFFVEYKITNSKSSLRKRMIFFRVTIEENKRYQWFCLVSLQSTISEAVPGGFMKNKRKFYNMTNFFC